ncbi:MAG TPA: DoxX-like family protein [Candidatus Methylomirabilis sp.]|nr:DoxX-like family protein [Candidatus Methylomirabilis sp.]
MVERRGEESQVPLLLRVGLGAVWVCEGLVGNLLGPGPELVAVLTRTLPLPGNPAVLIRALGAFELLLGLLLLLGWMVRPVASVQCGLLVAFSLLVSASTPPALVSPAGAISKNAALFAAGLCLVLLGGGRGGSPGSSRRLRAVPVILRLGLGLVWLSHGILLAGRFPQPTAAEFVARTGVTPGQLSVFLAWLGILEAALGLMILAGCCVRGLAVLQVGLLTAFTLVVGRTSPAILTDALGDLSKNLGLIGAALALYRVGGGPFALDAWLGRSPAWQRFALLATLQRSLAAKVGTAEVYRVQSQAPADPEADGLLQKLRLDEANGGGDVASLIRRQGGRPLPVAGLTRGLAWVLGCLTVILGMRVSFGVDVWLEEHGLRLYERAGRLLPPEDGITARALQAMRDREAQHVRLLRDHLRARRVRPPSSR